MKKYLTYFSIILAVFALGSCKKIDVVQDVNTLGKGSYVTLVKTNNTIIDYSNLSTSKVSITVKEYGSPVDKIKVYVTKGPTTLDRTKWKQVKEVPYSGETVLELTADEIAKGLGIPVTGLETGASYTLYNQVITKDGRSFDIANTNSEVAGNSNYNMALTWAAVVVCPFVSTGFGGNFEVIDDGWGDFNPGEIVTVSAVTSNSLTIMLYPAPGVGVNRKAIKVDINPATGAATVASQVYGDYPQFGIANIANKTVGANNYVFSCVGTITLRLNHTAGGSNFGDYTIRLKKK